MGFPYWLLASAGTTFGKGFDAISKGKEAKRQHEMGEFNYNSAAERRRQRLDALGPMLRASEDPRIAGFGDEDNLARLGESPAYPDAPGTDWWSLFGKILGGAGEGAAAQSALAPPAAAPPGTSAVPPPPASSAPPGGPMGSSDFWDQFYQMMGTGGGS